MITILDIITLILAIIHFGVPPRCRARGGNSIGISQKKEVVTQKDIAKAAKILKFHYD